VSLVVLTLATIYGIIQTRYIQNFLIKEITSKISESIDADVSIGSVRFSFFSKVVLNDFYISDQKKDTLLYTQKLVAGVDSISFLRKDIHFKSIVLIRPKVHVEKRSDNGFNFSFLLGTDSTRTRNVWNGNSSMVEIRNGEFFYTDTTLAQGFQQLMHLRTIDLMLERVKFSSDNDFSFNLKNLNFICENGLRVNDLSVSFWYADSTISLKGFSVASANSSVKIDTMAFDLKKYLSSHDFFDLKFDLLIDQIKLNYNDFSFLYPEFKGEGLTAEMSGRLYGKPGEIKGKNVKANLGDLTRINGDFYINGLPEYENTYLFINLLESYANLNQLRNITFPEKLFPIKIQLPKFLDNVGVFSYSGNFTGFLNDFVAYGSVYSNLGSIDGDVSFKPATNNVLKVKGHISTKNLRVGSIFNAGYLGKLTLKGDVEGAIKDTLFNLTFNGIVDTIDIKNYKYQNITIKGNLKNKLFDGSLNIDDPNLKLEYVGNLDLSPSLPVFKFTADVSYADLHELNLIKDSISKISCRLNANFEGNIIDNMQGQIDVEQLRYRNAIDLLYLERARIINTGPEDNSSLTIKSDWFDAEIKGQYHFLDLTNSLVRFYQHYMPSSYFATADSLLPPNNFSFVVNVSNCEPLTKVFVPSLILKSPFTIHGFFNEKNYGAHLLTTIPHIDYDGYNIENFAVNLKATHDKISCNIFSDNFLINDNLFFQNLNIESTGEDDKLSVGFSWKNTGVKKSMGEIAATAVFEKTDQRFPHVNIDIAPSTFYVTDSLWVLKESRVVVDSTSVQFNGISITNKDQQLSLTGNISENNDAKAIVNLQNIDFRMFDIFKGKTGFGGKLNGSVELSDFYRNKRYNLDLSLKGLSFDSRIIGDLLLKSIWNAEIEKLVSTVSLKDTERSLINGKGFIDPRNKSVDLSLDLDRTPISILQIFVPFLFYELDGGINGHVKISGKTDHLMFDGKLAPETRAQVGIKFLKTHYYFSDPVYLKADSILFPSIKIEDELGNKGIFEGSITHLSFQKMKYDLNINTDKILAMNTNAFDNDWFYGTAIAGGFLNISGKGNEAFLNGDFRTEKGTTINIPLERKGTVEKYDFIRFANTRSKAEQPVDYKLVSNGLNMNFDVDVTPEAKVQLIFNSQIGDVIKGEGNGNLQVKVDKDFNIKLYGDYVIEKGDYLFTLENIVNKRFTINRGGTIKWTGDPYDAQIDLTAVYKVKTSLNDLFPEGSSTAELDRVRRLPVDCIIKLKESLLQPTIDLKIELPTADESVKDAVSQLIVTREDENKQMISLLMMGRFYTPEFFAGKAPTATGSELVGSTASELLSNQLSNWLSQINDQVDIGINYRPGYDISNDQIELALSTQIFNDRVTIDGNLANNSNPNTKNSRDLVGDFDVKIKLNNDGRLQLKVYNHTNDYINYKNETGDFTQGVGFSYREEFNTLRELFERYKEAILRKRTKVTEPKGNL
jgi:hypothetical protein